MRTLIPLAAMLTATGCWKTIEFDRPVVEYDGSTMWCSVAVSETTTAEIPDEGKVGWLDRIKAHPWWTLAGVAATLALADLTEDGDLDAFGAFSGSGSGDVKPLKSSGESFIIDGSGNRISIHDESLSDNFTVQIRGDSNTFSTQEDKPETPQRFSPGAFN